MVLISLQAWLTIPFNVPDRQFPDEYYGENGVYIPRLYGRPWYEWAEELQLFSIKEIDKYLEERMNIIGQNGNVGYEDV